MIDLQLLGGLELALPDLPASARARRRHPMAVLALVAAAAPQGVSRDRIMAFLWPESDTARASNSLRQALHALRRDLGEDIFLPETGGGMQLDPAKVSVDLWTFRDAIARRAFDEAVAVHRGPFLDGFQIAGAPDLCRWAEAERAIVERAYVAALETLAREAEDAGRHDEAVQWRRRHAAADPCSSRAALGLLRALTAAGDRPGALAYAAVHENFLRTHLEVAPDPAVTAFVAELRRATPPGPIEVQAEEVQEAPRAIALRPTLAMQAVSMDLVAAPYRRPGGRRWVVAAALAGIALVGAGSAFSLGRTPAADAVIVLGSGSAVAGGRDTATQLVSCDGPLCPSGALPQAAFVVAKHEAYFGVEPGTQFIAPVANATSLKGVGAKCCTTAVFERTFVLPPDATSATVTVNLTADNQGSVSVNGREFGRQSDRWLQWNFAGPPKPFTTTIVPDPSGINRLRVTLWDGGGVAGLNFRAVVKYERQESAAR